MEEREIDERYKSERGSREITIIFYFLLLRRIVLSRWFMHCKEEKILVNIPSVTEEWVDLKDENTMYSPTLQDRGITDWEAGMCPWWIDYPIGVIPKQEKELRASMPLYYFCVISFAL